MSETDQMETPLLSVVFVPKLPHNSLDLIVQSLSSRLQLSIDNVLFSASGDQLHNEWKLTGMSNTNGGAVQFHPTTDVAVSSNGSCSAQHTVTKTSVTELLVMVGRHGRLFPPRATLLTVKEQQQALLLCLARRNKEIHGEFSAVASDLLDAWNTLSKRNFDSLPTSTEANKSIIASDPVERETSELLSAYSAFVRSSNNIDQFTLHSALCSGFTRQSPHLINAVTDTMLVVEGPISAAEWALLQPVLQYPRCIVYTTTLDELGPPSQQLTGRSPSFDLDISGIDDDIPATPPHPSSALVPSSSTEADSNTPVDSSNSGTVLTVGEGRVQLHLTKLAKKPNLSQAEVESKCFSCFEDITKPSCKLTWKTPVTKSSLRGECATPLARKLSDHSTTTVSRNKSGCLKQISNQSSGLYNSVTSSATAGATCVSLNTPTRKYLDARPSALHLSPGSSATPAVRRSPRHSAKETRGQACCQYVQQVMVSQIRLLLNTRDELALAVNCSLPGTELSQTAFADIKNEAQLKNMPMYQTILSIIQKIRLGGRGYQPDSSCPILSHVKPLTVFVDHLTKLDTILEDETDARRAATKILQRIKRYLVQLCSGINSKGCALKPATIESVHTTLVRKLETCWYQFQNTTAKKPSAPAAASLQPALQLLQRLCDSCAGESSSGGDSVVTLVSEGDEDDVCGVLLSQGYHTPSTAITPLRIPSVLTLFRTPPVAVDVEVEKPSLRVRLMKQQTPVRPPRHQLSCLDWAPDNLSPVQVIASPGVDDVPVLGPTLAAAAGPRRRSSQHWQEVIASLPDREEDAKVVESKTSNAASSKVVVDKGRKVMGGAKKRESGCKDSTASTEPSKKRSSKRSLLSDISNLAEEESKESAYNKKAKKVPSISNSRAKKRDTKSQPANQRSIMTYFKPK